MKITNNNNPLYEAPEAKIVRFNTRSGFLVIIGSGNIGGGTVGDDDGDDCDDEDYYYSSRQWSR